jgi:hypothetical protein
MYLLQRSTITIVLSPAIAVGVSAAWTLDVASTRPVNADTKKLPGLQSLFIE